MPPLRTAISPDPPLLAPFLRLPAVAATRALLRKPDERFGFLPPAGRVIGLVRSRPLPAPVHPVRETSTKMPAVEPSPRRVVPVVARPTPVHPVLTVAVDEYVGEPHVPVEPYRSSSFEQLVDQFGGGAEALKQAAMLALGGLSSSVEAPPPSRTFQAAPPPERGDRTLRRPTLAQSRRLGLAGSVEVPLSQPEFAPAPTLPPADSESVTELPLDQPADPVEDQRTLSEPVFSLDEFDSPVAEVVDPVVAEVAEPALMPPQAPPAQEIQQAEDRSPIADPEPVAAPRTPPTPHRRLGLGAPLTHPPASKSLPTAQPVSRTTPVVVTRPPAVATRPVAVAPEPVQPSTGDLPPDNPDEPVLASSVEPDRGEVPVPPEQDAVESVTDHPVPQVHPVTAVPSLGPVVYRAALDTVPPRVDDAGTDPTVRREPVPAEIVSVFQSTFGLDLADVPVNRGPGVTPLARSVAARAFAQGGEVFLPDEIGDLATPEARGLLAHELTHAAQQRLLGADLPPEQSPEGVELEAVAVTAERWYRGEGGPPAALVHLPARVELTETRVATEQARTLIERLTVPRDLSATALQRADEPTGTAGFELLGPTSGATTAPYADAGAPIPPPTVSVPSASAPTVAAPIEFAPTVSAPVGNTLPAVGPVPGMLFNPPGPLPESVQAGPDPEVHRLRAAVDRLTDAVAELADRPVEPATDLTDPATLDELTGRLYDRVRTNLRTELLVDRERAGLLTDLR